MAECILIDSGGGNSNLSIKTLTYIGTGSSTNTITFPEKPLMVIGYTQDSDPTYGNRYTRGIIPFVFSNYNAVLSLIWGDSQQSAPAQTVYYHANYFLTLNGNSMSWTGTDAPQALNQEGVKYTIYYI